MPTQKTPSNGKSFCPSESIRRHFCNKYAAKLKNKVLFVTSGESCRKVFSQDGSNIKYHDVPSLMCRHEEADTRLFLHARHASQNGHQSILIKSSDTDVEILACYYADKISSELYLHLGTQAKARLINISTLTAHLGPPVCNALLGLHALTGCDTVSAFAGKAKKKALGLIQSDMHWCNVMQELGKFVSPKKKQCQMLNILFVLCMESLLTI